ncbi:MAG TPA: hypothetical protein VFW09_08710 [Solirubrobacteraceae bacterium]|nr:hypothetical protein [Solirubrobacteraceae bacterium]
MRAYLDETIATLSEEVERRLAPFAHKAELLTTIPGVAQRTRLTRFRNQRRPANRQEPEGRGPR